MMKFIPFLAVAMLALTACASMTDTPNQNIHVATPGATGARCILATQDVRMVAYPPQTITIRRMMDPLKVTCQAPGNREKTVMVHSSVNKTATGNIATAGVGAVYDHFSGALYEYPSRIVVDFTHTRAGAQEMPKYHAPDTVSPFDQINEDMHDRPAQTPQDQGLKNAKPSVKSTYSKELSPAAAPSEPSGIERPY